MADQPLLFDLASTRTGPADFSPCRRYRYTLMRIWDQSKPLLLSLGLNPSTADEQKNDQTISNDVALATRWGYGGLAKANIFAFRATDPLEMWAAEDPVGPENDAYIVKLAKLGDGKVFCCWGSGKATKAQRALLLEREARIREILVGFELMCIGTTAGGHPWHPLMKPHSSPLRPWKRGVE